MAQHNQPIIIEIDGHRFEVVPEDSFTSDSEERKNGIFHLKGSSQFDIKVLETDLISGRCVIAINGQVKEIKLIREIDVMIERMGLYTSHSKKQSIVYAPMPGLVTSIKIAEGQHVDKGSPLIILEAMKMENVITAPHDAAVKAIRVTIGQAVERGFPLVEFS